MSEPQQQPTGVPDGWTVVTPAAAPPPAGHWEDRGIAGKVWHPDSGATERNRADNSLLGVPPELAVTSGVGVARAMAGAAPGVVSRAAAGAKSVVSDIATPVVKYEVTKSTLQKLGMPEAMAIPIAMAVSGYRKNGKPAASGAASDVAPAGVDRYLPSKSGYQAEATPASAAPASPVASSPAAPAPPGAEAVSTPAQSPTVEAPPSALSPQQMLNEEALARRRAEFQARQAAAPPEAPAPAAKPKLLASESPEYFRLLRAGKTPQQAMDVIEANRLLRERLGLKTPTVEETRFPKGMRGKVPE